jgi:hypothetical protein
MKVGRSLCLRAWAKKGTAPFFAQALSVAAILLALGTAGASEFHYVMVFGSERSGFQPAHTHSFATFIRVTGNGPYPNPATLQAWTISWLPRSLDIEFYRLLPEPGTNLDLCTTLRWALGDGQRVSVWGPYQIRKELFDEALRQVDHLRFGAVRYKAVDTGYPTDRVSNCIHAVSDVALNAPRLRIGTPGWGESASYFIVRNFQPWLLDPVHTHDWILTRLGLTNYPLFRRGLDQNPARSVVLRTLQRTAKIWLRPGMEP